MSHLPIRRVVIYDFINLLIVSMSLLSCFFCVVVYFKLKCHPGAILADIFNFMSILLVSSAPLGIEIVVYSFIFRGTQDIANIGAIVSDKNAIHCLAVANVFCVDKTGTLTSNKLELYRSEIRVYCESCSIDNLIRFAAMSSPWNEAVMDVLDALTISSIDLSTFKDVNQILLRRFDPLFKRSEAVIEENGKTFKVTKGSPHILMLLLSLEEDGEIIEKIRFDVDALAKRGLRCLAIAKTDDDMKWHILGLLTFTDPMRPDTAQAVAEAISLGIEVKILTGDHHCIALETSRLLNLGSNIILSTELPLCNYTTVDDLVIHTDVAKSLSTANAYAQMNPWNKAFILKSLMMMNMKTCMIGDGTNDIFALKLAHVGISVGGCTEATRLAAGIHIIEPKLSTVIECVKMSRNVYWRIMNFIVLRISSSLHFLIFFFLSSILFVPLDFMPPNWQSMDAFHDMETWPLIFRLPVLFIIIATLLVDVLLIVARLDVRDVEKMKDATIFLSNPTWIIVLLVLTVVSVFSSLLLLWLLLQSWNPNGALQQIGIGGLSYCRITMCMVLKLMLSDFFILFSVRTDSNFFFSSAPPRLFVILVVTAIIGCIAMTYLWKPCYIEAVCLEGLIYGENKAVGIFIVAFSVFFFIFQDLVKVIACRYYKEYKLSSAENEAGMAMPFEHVEIEDKL